MTLNLNHSGISAQDIAGLQPQIDDAWGKLFEPYGKDNKWLHLPDTMRGDLEQIQEAAVWVRKHCDVLLVIGIGGSFLGACSGIKMLQHLVDFPVKFLGLGFDAMPLLKFMEKYKHKRVAINVISKSGTTLEIVAAFNIIEKFFRNTARIFVTTGPRGHMRDYANATGVTTFDIPDGVGGRYSVLSSVGLFPFAVAGIDIAEMLDGAKSANLEDAKRYAAVRYLLHTKHKKDMEIFASFHENLSQFSRWWQQLFGESEGKQGRGLFPVSMTYTHKLHSMGQYVQQGKPIFFETIIGVDKLPMDLEFNPSEHPAMQTPVRTINELNRAAYLGTVKAHADAGVPVVLINAPDLSARSFGGLVYMFEVACGVSAYMLDVYPFDQPGVEFYKKNMREFMKK